MKAQQTEEIQKIQAVYLCITTDKNGNEKIAAYRDGDDHFTPLIASSKESFEVVKELGQELAEDHEVVVKIVKFSTREVQEVYGA